MKISEIQDVLEAAVDDDAWLHKAMLLFDDMPNLGNNYPSDRGSG